ncbi:MAG: LPS export ABC transporter protein LptC [Cyclobacteriaceae bacterium]
MRGDLRNSYRKTQEKSTLVYYQGRFFVYAAVILTYLFLPACGNHQELLSQEVYDGPSMEMTDVATMMSDSGRQALKLLAPLQRDYDNGDRDYPSGLYLEYYGKEETPICTFKSNAAIFKQEENLWTGEGNVHVKNLQNGDELSTELLYWSPAEEQFYTDKFVTILSEGEVHTGEGLRANQDFSSYQILKPSGTINLRENL